VPAPAVPAIDQASLQTLEAMMSPEDVRDFLQLYLDQADERVARILDLSSTGELGATAREAHTLVGTSGNVGAIRVSELARSIEQACKAGDGANASRFVSELNTAASLASAALRVWLDTRAIGA
jgi:HPt (histidine-containing phosphotransfer) domain-containing protein